MKTIHTLLAGTALAGIGAAAQAEKWDMPCR